MNRIQQAIEQGFDGIIKQGQTSTGIDPMDKSGDAAEICLYRGEGGRKCFVGQLIKDEFYSEDIENEPVSSDLVMQVLAKSGWSEIEYNARFLTAMAECQQIHDHGAPALWPTRKQEMINKYESKP